MVDMSSSGNAIYGNDISSYGEAARDEGYNQWDDGSRGNRYGSGGSEDFGLDGVFNASYNILRGDNVDSRPLARLAIP
jgi:hypothetical protein